MRFFLAGNSPNSETPVHVVDIDGTVPDRYREFLHGADVEDMYVGLESPVVQFACDYAAYAME